VPAPPSGLARVTVRAPRRRLDLAVPDQVPLAEILPDLLRRAGETAGVAADPRFDPFAAPTAAAGGWVLRRPDGATLQGETALANQGVRDGDVLYLVPHHVLWPEPDYDDIVEEIAASARGHGRAWDPTATRVFAWGSAALILATGLAALPTTGPPWTVPGAVAIVAGVVLIAVGALMSRALGDAVAGATAAGLGLPYVGVGSALVLGGNLPLSRLGAGGLLVGATALLLASAVGAVAVGHGLRVFAGGAMLGLAGAVGALLAIPMTPAGAAAVLTVLLVAGIGVAPLAAVRLGRLPMPVVSASAEALRAEPRPDRPAIHAAVARADDILAGTLFGVCVAVAACAVVLASAGGLAAPLLAALAGLALLLRARLFPAVAARLPLLIGGLVGSGAAALAALAPAGPLGRLVGVLIALVAVAVLVVTASLAHRRRPGTGSPYLGRVGDILDLVAVVALAPVACAVLGLFGWVRGLAG
jgi:type VII secretion integral membrane protein EccD